MDILHQRSKKVKKRVNENLIKFLFWNGYKLDAGNFIHIHYPPIRDSVFDMDYIPYHIQFALWGYFVLPKLRGQQRRMMSINLRKKQGAMQRRMQRYSDQVEKQRAERVVEYERQQEEYKRKQKEYEEFEESMKHSGF
jgi:hypothetical protein